MPRFQPRCCDRSHSAARIGFPQQRGQSAVPEATECGSNGPLIVHLAGVEPAEPLHEVESRTVNLDRINPPPREKDARANERYRRRAAA